ncbi:MAG: hypothetical protein KME22_07805 [Hassallia sp. WJT32-NPBG1]|nr:hypothetical protein [Hassallia sp. WJT32-NPBG1]
MNYKYWYDYQNNCYYDSRIIAAYYSYKEATVLVSQIKDNSICITLKYSIKNCGIKDFAAMVNIWKCEKYCNEHTFLEKLVYDVKHINIEFELGNEKNYRELEDLFQSLKPFVKKESEDISLESESEQNALKILISQYGKRLLATLPITPIY